MWFENKINLQKKNSKKEREEEETTAYCKILGLSKLNNVQAMNK